MVVPSLQRKEEKLHDSFFIVLKPLPISLVIWIDVTKLWKKKNKWVKKED